MKVSLQVSQTLTRARHVQPWLWNVSCRITLLLDDEDAGWRSVAAGGCFCSGYDGRCAQLAGRGQALLTTCVSVKTNSYQ